MKGKDILKLIPQRYPFMMVDTADDFTEDSCQTTLTVRYDNYFVIGGDELSETGLIEHTAQSASALAGYKSLGAESAPVGIIGEVKHFSCQRRPRVGETLHTTITFGMSFGNVTLADGETAIDGEVIARTSLKIFIQ
jgi:3-hydroxymyristoyl/3-hydroxydecanoyl-(acyl carrier protein) dehydratase